MSDDFLDFCFDFLFCWKILELHPFTNGEVYFDKIDVFADFEDKVSSCQSSITNILSFIEMDTSVIYVFLCD